MVYIICDRKCLFVGKLDHVPRKGETVIISCHKKAVNKYYVVKTLVHEIGESVIIKVIELEE